MPGKTDTEVVIGGKVYKLSGYESQEYIQKVASYMNTKIAELEKTDGYAHLSADNRALLLQLNIADDYFKAKEAAYRTDRDMDHRDKELYDLKHDLVAAQRKLEELGQEKKELASKNKELLLQKTKLESSLETALLGKIHTMKTEDTAGKSDEGSKEKSKGQSGQKSGHNKGN